jgi:transglutaminase-like putative cysteine protease
VITITAPEARPALTERARPLLWAAGALGGGVLLHLDRVPPWVASSAVLFILWRVGAALWRVPLPGGIVRTLLALILVGAVFVRFHTLNGLSAGTALLVMMSAIKLLETHRRRDEYIVVGGGLILLLAACLDRQSLMRAPLYLLQTWLCCSAFAVVGYAPPDRPGKTGQYSPGSRLGFSAASSVLLAGRTLLLALPLAVVLFVFFPRLPGAFWALPHSEEAVTGLGDTMSPGSITQLTSSYEIAFRVRFDGAPPPPQERYWRGPVLHEFDGYTWRRSADLFYRLQRLEYLGTRYRYHVSLEPSRQRWWFALDTPDSSPDPKVFFTYDYQLIAGEPVNEETSYDATSHTRTRASEALTALGRRHDTTLPPGRNPRALQFAHDLRARAGTDAQFVDAVLDYFRTKGFVYSLTPPRLGTDSVDDFLFETRSGFCGHYASAFVSLMRAGGVPARVVTGYLGGEWNPIGGYFTIRQSDAHSWAEVWLEGRGWTRVDPTGVVEPERLQRGILDLLPDAVSAPARLVRASPWLTDIVQRWDAVNAWWNDHVLKFDYHAQLGLLDRLGIESPDARHLGWAFVITLLGWLGWIAWQFGRTGPARRPDRLARAYSRLCSKLADAGLAREAHVGPLAYADMIKRSRPDLDPTLRLLLTRYAELRFGAASEDPPVQQVVQFEREVARLQVA